MRVRARKISVKNDLGGVRVYVHACVNTPACTRSFGSLLAGSRSQSFPCLHKDLAH